MKNTEKYEGIIPAFYACYDAEGKINPEGVVAGVESGNNAFILFCINHDKHSYYLFISGQENLPGILFNP